MHSLTLLILLWFSFFTPPPENTVTTRIRYVVTHKGEKVGEIKASKSSRDNQVVYESETKMTIKVIMKQDVEYSSRALYQNGVFVSSVAKSYLNDKLRHQCVTQWKGKSYEIKRDNEKTQLTRQVTYSGAMLYFKEPVGVGLIYSEMTGTDNRMSRTGEHTFILTDGQSKKQNKYWYKNGILDHAFINHTLVDIEIQRVY
jgi:hypothetical protein